MKSPQLIVLLSGILIFSAIYYFADYLPFKDLKKNHCFTIAVVTSIESQSEGSREAYIIYSYKNRSYRGNFPLILGYEDKFKVGSKVFIMFSPKNPKNAKVDYDKVVPDKLEAPVYGWAKLP